MLPTQPNNPVAHQYMGDIYLLEDNLDLALESYSQAVRFSSLSPALASRLGNVWMQKGDYLMAIVYCRHWVNSSPNNPAAHYSLGIALRNRERVDEARLSLQTSADLYMRLGDAENFEKVRGFKSEVHQGRSSLTMPAPLPS
ncbi:MAG: hypothetical protein HC922_07400 [Leptolyngbyaceae cyanobacterium SM2_3_12]|nr:hypothetical protein [Leptolyngbyaceae cyanobacterium SM2_3_12]